MRATPAEANLPPSTSAPIREIDPLFIEKVRDIAGLYLHPPERWG